MGTNLILETLDLFLSSLTFTYFFEKKKKKACNRVNNSIIKDKSLYPCQYRFCKDCYSEHALLDIVGKIQKHMDEKLFSCGFLLIHRKLLIVSTTIFCSINYIIMDYLVSSSNGSPYIMNRVIPNNTN